MGKVLIAAVFLAAVSGVNMQGAYAKGSNLGVSADSSASIARQAFNKRKKNKEVSSTFSERRAKRNRK